MGVYKTVIKGGFDVAVAAAEARGLRVCGISFPVTVKRTFDSILTVEGDREILSNWFVEDNGCTPPFAKGSLLFYNEVNNG
jgi:hypothetical protein